MDFIHQPHGQPRLGEYLTQHFADLQWTHFRAAVAFAKRSGVNQLKSGLEAFRSRGGSALVTVGIDMLGTSREALELLRQSLPEDALRVYYNAGSSTFHPKVYLFRNATHADVIVGSGNLTAGGLFTNYEASLAVSLDVAKPEDLSFLQAVEQILDTWSEPINGRCYILTPALLAQLVAADLVRGEVQIAIAKQAAAAAAAIATTMQTAQDETNPAPTILFTSSAVPPAPSIPTVITPGTPGTLHPPEAPETLAPPIGIEDEDEDLEGSVSAVDVTGMSGSLVVPMQANGVSNFVMTLQNTDVGVGQITAGTSARSPEVFIPLSALDANPAFWSFPGSFTEDVSWNAANPEYRRDGFGKLDRHGVAMRIGTIASVNMFFNPRKGDFRLRHENMRSAGNVGDLMLIRLVDPSVGFNYDVQVVTNGAPFFNQLQALCTEAVRNSQKRFGYF